MSDTPVIRSTTILSVHHNGAAALGGDGQVTLGDTIMKLQARKVRRMYNDQILAGFAGGAADALTLFERFEAKLEQYNGNLSRAAVELAKEWRTDRFLRRLEAQILVADKSQSYVISGTGDVIEPDGGVVSIGSGGGYARAAAEALIRHANLSAEEVVRQALEITADICIYTNSNLVIETL